MKEHHMKITIAGVFAAAACFMPIEKSYSKPAGEVITLSRSPLVWRIETAVSVYELGVADDGIVVPVYYGPKGQIREIRDLPLQVDPIIGSKIREVPYRGGFVEQTPGLEVVYADHTRDCELVYQSHEIVEIGGYPCLRIDMADKFYQLEVSSFIRVIPDKDILEKWLSVKNQSDKAVLLENAQSGSVWLEPDEYELLHFSGQWSNEFMMHKTRLTPGVKTLQVRDFFSWTSPWFAVMPEGRTDEHSGPVWFGQAAYAGNWRMDFDKSSSGNLQIIGGINFWDTALTLKPQDTFQTPKMIFGFSPNGLNGASQRLHDYIRNDVIRKETRNKIRPVLYNSWFATEFDVQEDQQLKLVERAKDIGVELFVIDDGWFKGRISDKAGLGDWEVDKNKFPNGLKAFIEKVNQMGMEFGIWIEPEMANKDSDLYRAHPDWVLHYPNRVSHEHRNQLMLNLARPDVCDYLFAQFNKLLSENKIAFIKWDRNRALSEAGWPDAPADVQREVRLRYIDNLFKLIDALQASHPDVLFETCSGGGGRINLAMLSRMDQAWPSDNTNPSDRVMMQYGYLHAFPANTMASWVTDVDWHRAAPPLEYRFDVAMAGVLGIGSDITKWSRQDVETAKKKIAQYKHIRDVVQNGTLYRLESPFQTQRCALQYVSADKTKSVVFMYNMWDTIKLSTPATKGYQNVRLKGLDEHAVYAVSDFGDCSVSGQTLMHIGLPWLAYGDTNSRIFVLEKKQIKNEDSRR
ncbi:MAG TPA: alpha-galactosidase [Anaerohalosphaeraceae bacterium]|nr:alpha-galactosidase [Anaerohalosphaeraceae bacterium]